MKIEEGAVSLNFELRTSNFFLGVDVGGTTTRVGVVSTDGHLIQSDRFETPRSAGSFFDRMAARVSAWSDQVEPTAPIGVALPGPVDRARGVLVRSVNLPFLQEIPLESELSGRLSRRVVLMTDAEAAAWGEFSIFAPRPARFVHFRFGTGIACGFVMGGVLVPTDPTRRTHRPELVVDRRPDAAACACGLRGCLELFAGGPALRKLAGRMKLPCELSALQTDFAQGRGEAKALISVVAEWIVQGIRNVTNSLHHGCFIEKEGDEAPQLSVPRQPWSGFPKFEVQSSKFEETENEATRISEPRQPWSGFPPPQEPLVICLGGGVLASLPSLFESVCARWTNQCEVDPRSVELCRASLGDDAGIIGAATLAHSW